MVIRILDHVRSASTYADGEVIFRLISDRLSEGEIVTVSFDGIGSVPSAFINGAFVRLLETRSFDEIRAKLRFADSTRHVNDLIKSRFEFVARTGESLPSVPEGIYHVRFLGPVDAGEGMVVVKGNTVNGGDSGYTFRGRIYGTGDGVAADLRVTRWNPRRNSIFGDLREFELTLVGTADPRARTFDVTGSVRGQPQYRIRIVGKFASPVTS